jgi:hypothetical protein
VRRLTPALAALRCLGCGGSLAEALGWFHAWGFEDVRALRGYTPRGSRYDWIHDHGLLPGSGISVVGRRPATASG